MVSFRGTTRYWFVRQQRWLPKEGGSGEKLTRPTRLLEKKLVWIAGNVGRLRTAMMAAGAAAMMARIATAFMSGAGVALPAPAPFGAREGSAGRAHRYHGQCKKAGQKGFHAVAVRRPDD